MLMFRFLRLPRRRVAMTVLGSQENGSRSAMYASRCVVSLLFLL